MWTGFLVSPDPNTLRTSVHWDERLRARELLEIADGEKNAKNPLNQLETTIVMMVMVQCLKTEYKASNEGREAG